MDLNFERIRNDKLDILRDISVKTFIETFASQNKEENIKQYLDAKMSLANLKKELNNMNSYFYFIIVNNKSSDDSIEIAKVTSSVQLSAEQQKNIAEKLKTITGAKQIKLALKVDPTLIGGFTVEIGSKLIDTSIRGQLKQITTLLGA